MLDRILTRKNTKRQGADIKLEVPAPEYIPYACHYDPDTVLTKNGELIQVIKITGRYTEHTGIEKPDLRNLLQKAVLDHIKSNDFSLWFHTIRKKQSLDPGGEFQGGFAMDINKLWKQKNSWDNQYVNEVYVSVIRGGASAGILNPGEILKTVAFSTLKKSHDEFLSMACEELTATVSGMLATLEPFGATRLTFFETRDGFYSQQLQFFARILNLSELLIPVPIRDLSEYLATHGIAFGFNTMQVRGSAGKNFGAIFNVKDVRQIIGPELDKFLQLPQEFIITQSIDFINCKQALREFKKQNYILQVSGADDFAEAIGLNDIVKSDTGSGTDFGDSQVTILLLDSNLQQLERNIKSATDALRKIGLVSARMDLRMEECFWAQLPGNFSYISCKRPINTKRAGALASLYYFPTGNRSGNIWGQAVTTFHTANKTPYFFNFHHGNNGNTIIIGPLGSGKTVLMNFLVAESRKFNCRLFFFDQLRASKVFIKSLGGFYSIIKPREKNKDYAFNPFDMQDTRENRTFLKQWIIYVAEAGGLQASPQEKGHLATLIDYVYGLPQEMRRLSVLAGHFGGEGPASLENRMAPWCGEGDYSHIFDNDGSDITSFKDMIYGFGMSFILRDQASFGPVFSYLLHRIEMTLDGTPTMIVLDEAWNLINNPIFAPGIMSWLERLQAHNAMVIFASENINNAGAGELTRSIAGKVATQIFLPNSHAEESNFAYRDVWGLSEEEFIMLAAMNKDKRQFMLRQGEVFVITSLDLSGMKELDVLSGSDKTVKVMDDTIAKNGATPEDWLPAFYERMKEIRGILANEGEKLFIA